MRRVLYICIVISLFLVIAGCAQRNDADSGTLAIAATATPTQRPLPPIASAEPVYLSFSSLDEFMGALDSRVPGRTDDEFLVRAEHVNFSSLERFYLPTGIPETFRLHAIEVYETFVLITYFPETRMVAEAAIRGEDHYNQSFYFQFFRWDTDDPRSGVLQQEGLVTDDLIDGKYFFIEWPSVLYWFSERSAMRLQLPQRPTPGNTGILSAENSVDGRLVYSDARALAPFTEMMVIDLRDEASIAAARAAFRN